MAKRATKREAILTAVKRHKKGVSVAELAAETETSESYVRNVLTGAGYEPRGRADSKPLWRASS